MKKFSMLFGLVSVLILITTCNPKNSAELQKQSTSIHIGMTLSDFQSIAKKAYQDAGNSNRFIDTETIFGISGRWTYYFDSGILRWYVFNAYEKQISKSHFDKFLNSTEELFKNYNRELGKARKVRQGITKYNDPVIQNHNGYLVQQATWDSPEGRRSVEFSFLGDHHTYALLLSIHVSQ